MRRTSTRTGVGLALVSAGILSFACTDTSNESLRASNDPVIQELDRNAELMELPGVVISRITGCRIPIGTTSDATQEVYGDQCLALVERGGLNNRTLISYRFVAHLVVRTEEGNYTVDLPYCSDGVTCVEPRISVGDSWPREGR